MSRGTLTALLRSHFTRARPMAIDEHLQALTQGAQAWNQWRRQHFEVRPDLREAPLSSTDLTGANLSNANLFLANLNRAKLYVADLSEADLSQADLNGANLNCADLRRANLHRSNLVGADLTGADLTGAVLTDARLKDVQLRGATLIDTIFRHVDLSGIDLSGADLRNAFLQGSFLSNANLGTANLSHANLMQASLSEVNFASAALTDANLRGAYLIGADFSKAHLVRANLSGAKLRGANFNDADLTGVNFNMADLKGAQVFNAITGDTIFEHVDLRGIQGLETIKHLGPSGVGISTIYLSEGQIAEVFLRGCGVPENFIVYMRSLTADALEFYSCFISYSGKDEGFARRLHSRMREAELRVWFAPEDMKGGDKLYDQIDRAIQVHDRLLLVLSESSMQSRWVETEIRRARTVELREGRRKLFPIRLVSYEALLEWVCVDSTTGEDLAVEVRSYFIPDFSNWKSHDDFERAFARLLADLKASA